MAVLRLELGIDSDVYPELYAKVASLERLEAREEKLRELATTGLIWEFLRLHGPGFVEAMPATPAEAMGVGSRPDAGLSPVAQAIDELRAKPPETSETTTPSAIDAGAVSDHVPHIPENVPVLLEVVDEAERAVVIALADAAPKPVADSAATSPEPHESVTESAAAASLARATVTKARSARMKRMKDSGLFQNG
jgi:hypothetical protein